MMKMCRYALITALAIFLAGCAGLREQPAPVEEAKPQPQQPGPIEHQDQQSGQPAPRVRHYDWNGAVQPLVGQMLQASGVNAGSILLVDSVNNRTNGSLNAGEATTALRSALAGNGKFTLVSAQQLAVAKQQLGLSPQDSSAAAAKPWASPATWARSMCFTPMPPATSTRLS
ncbi:lipoprotein YcfM [Klebsiella pneumoniae]|uniref:Lipoprotein YcfM n=1 Tax=Klebsiella pneumoniae TaxID=573 RepID=A0A378BF80_KLEPN|nr:lipoprotein YcfM [Klebsiella pneumoniae]